MPVVRLSDSTFERLSHVKTWLQTKTPDETIFRLVTMAMVKLGIEADEAANERLSANADETYGGGNGQVYTTCPQSLMFTKVTQAQVDNVPVSPANWAQVMLACIRRLAKTGVTGSALQALLHVPSRLGPYADEGYRFYPDLGLSIQGQSASDAGAEACRLARIGGFTLNVAFLWRQNEAALHPGQTATLRIMPKS